MGPIRLLSSFKMPPLGYPQIIQAVVYDYAPEWIEVFFDRQLDINSIPSNENFLVSGGKECWYIEVDGNHLGLFCNGDYAQGDNITFSYVPSGTPLKGADGTIIPAWSAHAATWNGEAPPADITAPLVSSMVARDANTIRVTFNEITTPTVAGWLFDNGLTNVAPSAVTQVNGSVWDFTRAGLAYGQTITGAYSSTTGNTLDAAGNELVTFSGAAVTNSIAATDTTPPTVISLQAINATTIRGLFSEPVNPTTAGWSFDNGLTNQNPSAVALVSGNTYDFTVTGLAYGQVITGAYNSATGNTLDIAGNELVTFTGAAVTNGIAAPGGTSLSFTEIPFSDPDLKRPGAGLEFWIWDSAVRVPLQTSPTNNELDRYDRFEWKSFEDATQGVYNWSEFDASINTAIDRGQKFSFGIMSLCDSCTDFMEYVGGAKLTSYPKYLHTLMQSEGNKDWIWAAGNTWIPNYNSTYYLDRNKALLDALAAHIAATSYSGVNYADIIRYVDIRGIGNYGEWHHYNYLSSIPTGRFPTVATYKRIVDDYKAAFPDFQLVVLSDGFDTAGESNTPAEVVHYLLTQSNNVGRFGYRRDNIGSGWAGSSYWVGTKLENNPATYNPGSGTVILKNLIMDRWREAPLVGEVMGCCSTDGGSQLYWDLVRQVDFYHINSLGNGNLESKTSTTTINAVRLAAKTMGYRLQINSGTISGTITRGTPFSLSLDWENAGVSPTYENWDIDIELRSGATVVWSGQSTFNPRLFLPGTQTVNDSFTVPVGVAAGTYNLHLIVRDPGGYRGPMPLYITGVQADGSYIIKSNVVIS